MATAVDDGLVRRNPCRIRGASVEKSPERPLLTVSQVYALADAVDRRYRALILLACFCGLRWGELAGLQRADIDCDHRTVASPGSSARCPVVRRSWLRPNLTLASAPSRCRP
jgi:integrase